MVKLACMTLPYAKSCSFERALEGIAHSGYRYVAFGHPHDGREVPDDPEVLKALFVKYNLTPVMLVGKSHFLPDQPIERAVQRMELAKALGIREVHSLGTWGYRKFPDEPLSPEEMEFKNSVFAEHFRKIGKEAVKRDLVMTIKPHTGNTATAAHIMETLSRIDSPNVLGSYDPGNVHFYEGVSSESDLPQMLEKLVSFIVKDHRGPRANRDFPVPGTGDVHFPKLFAMMKQCGFNGNIAVERVDGLMEVDQITERLTKSRINLERMLTEAGFTLE